MTETGAGESVRDPKSRNNPEGCSADVPAGRQRSRSGLVYFLLAAEVWRVKIGWAGDPTSRLVNLQVASPVEVALLGCMATSDPLSLERYLHRRFQHLHVRGEWFSLAPDLVSFIHNNRSTGLFHNEQGDALLEGWERPHATPERPAKRVALTSTQQAKLEELVARGELWAGSTNATLCALERNGLAEWENMRGVANERWTPTGLGRLAAGAAQ